MLKVENLEAFNFEGAFRGLRNPMNSWSKSDSDFSNGKNILGEKDIDLAQRMIKAGSSDRKYLRQIFVSMDITAPLYWLKEFDTYKVSTVSNSCSTMHKIHSKEFTLDDFSCDHLNEESLDLFEKIIDKLNANRILFNAEHDKEYWWQMIKLLPSNYNQKRTVTLNYEILRNIVAQRSHHKLDEWKQFIEALHELPYAEELIFFNNKN